MVSPTRQISSIPRVDVEARRPRRVERSTWTGLARGTAVRKVRRMDVRLIVGAALCTTMLAGSAWGQDVPVPSLTQENGRHVLLVDGRPFIILGGQVTNSR